SFPGPAPTTTGWRSPPPSSSPSSPLPSWEPANGSAAKAQGSSYMLYLTDVQIQYPGAARPAVREANLTVAAGEILALLGPSGCRKSSLLRAVAGLEASTGTITWDGHDVADTPTHERGFGLMLQEGQLFPHRTVGGNVAFRLALAGVARATRRDRVGRPRRGRRPHPRPGIRADVPGGATLPPPHRRRQRRLPPGDGGPRPGGTPRSRRRTPRPRRALGVRREADRDPLRRGAAAGGACPLTRPAPETPPPGRTP